MKFTKQTTFLGRNGMFKATGLNATVYRTLDNESVVALEPITSKGIVGRCNIEIPREDLPTLIAKLQSLTYRTK